MVEDLGVQGVVGFVGSQDHAVVAVIEQDQLGLAPDVRAAEFGVHQDEAELVGVLQADSVGVDHSALVVELLGDGLGG